MTSKLFKKIEERLHILADMNVWAGSKSLRTQYLLVAAETIRVCANEFALKERSYTWARELRAYADELINRAGE